MSHLFIAVDQTLDSQRSHLFIAVDQILDSQRSHFFIAVDQTLDSQRSHLSFRVDHPHDPFHDEEEVDASHDRGDPPQEGHVVVMRKLQRLVKDTGTGRTTLP